MNSPRRQNDAAVRATARALHAPSRLFGGSADLPERPIVPLRNRPRHRPPPAAALSVIDSFSSSFGLEPAFRSGNARPAAVVELRRRAAKIRRPLRVDLFEDMWGTGKEPESEAQRVFDRARTFHRSIRTPGTFGPKIDALRWICSVGVEKHRRGSGLFLFSTSQLV